MVTKNKGPLKLDWYREPKNMENRFVNYTTLVVNTILLFLSIIFVVLVHTHKVCPPPDFILNSEDHEGDRCIFARNSSASLSLDTLHISNASRIISTRNQSDNSNQDSYSFDILMFSLVMPMGLTSLLMALSRQWISKVVFFIGGCADVDLIITYHIY